MLNYLNNPKEQSRQKLQHYKSRADLVQCSFKDHQPNGKFDIVYSILALHHVPDEDKEKLFRKVREILKSCSAFIMIDLLNGANDELTKRYQTLTFEHEHTEEGSNLSLVECVN